MSMWTKLKIGIVVAFAIAVTGLLTYHFMWTVPKKECLESGRWWAGRWRDCASPVDLREFPDMSAFFDEADLKAPPPDAAESEGPNEPAEDATAG